MLMTSLKRVVFHSHTAVGTRVMLPHTGKCPKELVRIKKSFDHSAVVTASVVGQNQCLFGVIFLTMQLILLRIVGMVKFHCHKASSA